MQNIPEKLIIAYVLIKIILIVSQLNPISIPSPLFLDINFNTFPFALESCIGTLHSKIHNNHSKNAEIERENTSRNFVRLSCRKKCKYSLHIIEDFAVTKYPNYPVMIRIIIIQ
jgi:hypothetical protein